MAIAPPKFATAIFVFQKSSLLTPQHFKKDKVQDFYMKNSHLDLEHVHLDLEHCHLDLEHVYLELN